MKILNRALRKEFGTAGYCELCGLYCRKRAGHHLWTRNPEITVRINLISLGFVERLPDGRTRFSCRCHRQIHDGNIPRDRVLEVVARREQCRPEDIVEVMHWMRRLIKPTAGQIDAALHELSAPAMAIAARELIEAGKLERT